MWRIDVVVFSSTAAMVGGDNNRSDVDKKEQHSSAEFSRLFFPCHVRPRKKTHEVDEGLKHRHST
jgi:hypothetical protein